MEALYICKFRLGITYLRAKTHDTSIQRLRAPPNRAPAYSNPAIARPATITATAPQTALPGAAFVLCVAIGALVPLAVAWVPFGAIPVPLPLPPVDELPSANRLAWPTRFAWMTSKALNCGLRPLSALSPGRYQRAPHSGSQASAAASAETPRTGKIASPVKGAAMAVRESQRAKRPLKASWSTLHLPMGSQASS